MIGLTSSISISEMDMIDRCICDIAQEGGHHAMEKLYSVTRDAVYGYALSILKNSHDAEDVLHDCYLCVYRSADGYVSSGKPMAWIFTIVRNLCIDKQRSHSRYSDIPEEDWEGYLTANAQISHEDKIVLAHCIRDLAKDEREILLLHVLSGLKHREIAQMMDRPLSTILSKYHRTLKKLKRLLEEEDETNG